MHTWKTGCTCTGTNRWHDLHRNVLSNLNGINVQWLLFHSFISSITADEQLDWLISLATFCTWKCFCLLMTAHLMKIPDQKWVDTGQCKYTYSVTYHRYIQYLYMTKVWTSLEERPHLFPTLGGSWLPPSLHPWIKICYETFRWFCWQFDVLQQTESQ